MLFHNRGLLHSVVGAFADHEVRLFRQCNIAASSFPDARPMLWPQRPETPG